MPRVTRRGLLAGGLAAGALGLGLRGALASAPGSRGVDTSAPIPQARGDLNLLIVMVDQERAWATLPGSLDMPGHRRVAEAGTSFTNAYCTTPLCTPSRSVIWTGQHVQRTGVFDNTEVPVFGRTLDPAIPTLGHMLREMGFYTAYKGKWHLSGLPKDAAWGASAARQDALEPYGFADYGWGQELIDSQDGWKYDGRIAAEAADWLTGKARTLDAPWALTVSFVNPHDIMFFDATGRQAATRAQNVFPGPVLGLPDDPLYEAKLTRELPRDFRAPTQDSPLQAHADYARYKELFYGQMPHEDSEAWIRFANYYLNCIRDVDRHLGTVLDALEASGQADNTVVVLTSDHGEMGGVHGLRQKGPWMYRENLSVPFVVSHPDARVARENAGIVSTVDFTPTMLGLLGADSAQVARRYTDMAGTDASSDVTSTSTARSREDIGALVTYSVTHHADPDFAEAVLSNYATPGPVGKARNMLDRGLFPDLTRRSFMRGVITDTHKFARYFAPRDHHRPATVEELTTRNDLELFDLVEDPGETRNVAQTSKAALGALNTKLNTLIAAEVGPDDGSYLPGPATLWRGA